MEQETLLDASDMWYIDVRQRRDLLRQKDIQHTIDCQIVRYERNGYILHSSTRSHVFNYIASALAVHGLHGI